MPEICNPEDISAILEAYRAAVGAVMTADYEPSILKEWASRTTEEFAAQNQARQRYVAEFDGKIVGYAGLDFNKAVLTECYVLPEFSGKGVGTALVQTVEEAAREADLMSLSVLASLNAVNFYRKSGFVEGGFEFLRMADGQKMRCMILRKTLSI